ncbi:uncharacterized protein LOC133354947 isoform X2 [Lethenteron reissneri]|uniref:uncharacterized protein LOC133354947 isoform X2 n=1 Tax=Lethenteron reissneri TaxID=7753 RepID=UPI002AB65761|nr:uncharacterized protein LOC133354947 isoform X2 [Lethenteron reissneri]
MLRVTDVTAASQLTLGSQSPSDGHEEAASTSSEERLQHNGGVSTPSGNACGICGKFLSSASSLDRHMLVHSGERPHRCRVCQQAFTTSGNMQRHLKIHEKDPGPSLSPARASMANASSAAEPSPEQPSCQSTEVCVPLDAGSSADPVGDANRKDVPVRPRPRRPSARKRASADIVEAGAPLLLKKPRHKMSLEVGEDSRHCPVCLKPFVCELGVDLHLASHSPPAQLRCHHCNAPSVRTPRSFLRHDSGARRQHENGTANGVDSSSSSSSCTANLVQFSVGVEGAEGIHATVGHGQAGANSVPVGFRDLSFIDFSCDKFPKIAQVWCERNVRRCISRYHRFVCDDCGKAFPVMAALSLHRDIRHPASARAPGKRSARRLPPAPAPAAPPTVAADVDDGPDGAVPAEQLSFLASLNLRPSPANDGAAAPAKPEKPLARLSPPPAPARSQSPSASEAPSGAAVFLGLLSLCPVASPEQRPKRPNPGRSRQGTVMQQLQLVQQHQQQQQAAAVRHAQVEGDGAVSLVRGGVVLRGAEFTVRAAAARRPRPGQPSGNSDDGDPSPQKGFIIRPDSSMVVVPIVCESASELGCAGGRQQQQQQQRQQQQQQHGRDGGGDGSGETNPVSRLTEMCDRALVDVGTAEPSPSGTVPFLTPPPPPLSKVAPPPRGEEGELPPSLAPRQAARLRPMPQLKPKPPPPPPPPLAARCTSPTDASTDASSAAQRRRQYAVAAPPPPPLRLIRPVAAAMTGAGEPVVLPPLPPLPSSGGLLLHGEDARSPCRADGRRAQEILRRVLEQGVAAALDGGGGGGAGAEPSEPSARSFRPTERKPSPNLRRVLEATDSFCWAENAERFLGREVKQEERGGNGGGGADAGAGEAQQSPLLRRRREDEEEAVAAMMAMTGQRVETAAPSSGIVGVGSQCAVCRHAAPDRAALLRHLRDRHGRERPFACRVCLYPFTLKANCERHLKRRHGLTARPDIDVRIELLASPGIVGAAVARAHAVKRERPAVSRGGGGDDDEDDAPPLSLVAGALPNGFLSAGVYRRVGGGSKIAVEPDPRILPANGRPPESGRPTENGTVGVGATGRSPADDFGELAVAVAKVRGRRPRGAGLGGRHKPYRCRQCRNIFSTRSNVYRHVQSHHAEAVAASGGDASHWVTYVDPPLPPAPPAPADSTGKTAAPVVMPKMERVHVNGTRGGGEEEGEVADGRGGGGGGYVVENGGCRFVDGAKPSAATISAAQRSLKNGLLLPAGYSRLSMFSAGSAFRPARSSGIPAVTVKTEYCPPWEGWRRRRLHQSRSRRRRRRQHGAHRPVAAEAAGLLHDDRSERNDDRIGRGDGGQGGAGAEERLALPRPAGHQAQPHGCAGAAGPRGGVCRRLALRLGGGGGRGRPGQRRVPPADAAGVACRRLAGLRRRLRRRRRRRRRRGIRREGAAGAGGTVAAFHRLPRRRDEGDVAPGGGGEGGGGGVGGVEWTPAGRRGVLRRGGARASLGAPLCKSGRVSLREERRRRLRRRRLVGQTAIGGARRRPRQRCLAAAVFASDRSSDCCRRRRSRCFGFLATERQAPAEKQSQKVLHRPRDSPGRAPVRRRRRLRRRQRRRRRCRFPSRQREGGFVGGRGRRRR